MQKKKPGKITALITAVGGRSVGYQILECLLPLRRKYRLVTTDMDAFSPGLYEADAHFLLPSANNQNYIQRLLALVRKENIDVILPGSHQEVMIIAKHQDLLKKNGVVPIVNPYEMTKLCFDKLRLAEFLVKKHILTPQTLEITDPFQAKKMKFPIVLKPSKDTGGSKNVHIIKNMMELEVIFKQLHLEGIALIAQEYVGNETEEYTVGIVVGTDGVIVDSIVMKRYLIGLSRGEERMINNKSYVLSTGYSQGFFVHDPQVKQYCEYVAKIVGARGPINIQCRKTEKGIYIFEIHPRFSGSASMRALMGFNEPYALIQNFFEKKQLASIPHRLNFAVIRKFANIVVSINEYERSKNSL